MRTLRNILDKRTREEWQADPGLVLLDYAPPWVVEAGDALRIVRNGLLIGQDEAQAMVARPGDEVIFYVAPAGWEIPIYFAISMAFAAISYAIAAATAPSAPPLPETLENSPTYGFDGLANTIRPGTSVPIVYGTHRVGGHIISQFTRQSRKNPLEGELHTLLALCTGPVEAITDIRVNRNPMADYGADVTKEARLGGQHQEVIAGFDEIVNAFAKDAALVQVEDPLTFTTSAEVDRFTVVARFAGGLYAIGDKGQFNARQVLVGLRHRRVGDLAWIEDSVRVIEKKIQSAFDVWIDSPRLTRAQYEIQVTRLTVDDTDATGYSDSTIVSVDEIIEEALTYPRLALLAIKQLPTNQVSGQPPQYDCLVKGKLVRIYTTTTAYTTAWSDNPAWCCLDLLTNRFDGLGAWVGDYRVDIQSFIDWAAYCDELVPIDVQGATEKRFTLNIVLDGSLSAVDAINQICMTGRANFMLKGDQWSVRVDHAEAPVQFFQMSRITKDSFSVSKRANAELANYLVGEFWNEELDYEQDTLPLEDQTAIVGSEQIEKTVSLLGTTSASQAMRHLAYYMLANRLCRRTIEHDVGTEALAMEAGDVYRVAHDVPGWGFSGRLRSVDETGSILRLDRNVTIESGKTYELTVIHPSSDDIDVVRVMSNPGTMDVINVSRNWTVMPIAGTDYSFGEVGSSTVLYRCMSITASSNPAKRHIRGREYNAAIYEPDLTVLPLASTTRLPDSRRIPPAVTNLRLNERTAYAEDGTLSAAIDIHFTLPFVTGVQAQAFWRRVGDVGWQEVGAPVSSGYITIDHDVETPGSTYEISVVSVSATGNRKHPDDGVKSTITTTGSTRRPGIVTGFGVDRTVSGLVFRWFPLDPVTNFDLAYYEIRDGATWDTATVVGQTAATTLETIAFVQGTRTYLIKGFNTVGRDSPTAAAVVMIVDARIGENVIFTRTEDPTWPGTLESMVVDAGDLVLETEAGVVAWRASPQITAPFHSSIIAGGYGTGFRVSGSYTTAAFEVASQALRCLVGTDLEADQVDMTAYWNSPALADKTWDSEFAKSRSWNEAPGGRVEIRTEMRFSTAATAVEGSFGPWQVRPQNIEVLVRWAQVRVVIVVRDSAYTAKLKRLRILFDVPDVVEGGVVTTSQYGTVDVVFEKAFNAEPKVAATVIGATAGDDIFIPPGDKTAAGFKISVRDAANALVVRTVNFTAVGY
ncbi:MAG: phage tail protein [Pseudomonadota bacterium]